MRMIAWMLRATGPRPRWGCREDAGGVLTPSPHAKRLPR
jgi:hypothetical protein